MWADLDRISQRLRSLYEAPRETYVGMQRLRAVDRQERDRSWNAIQRVVRGDPVLDIEVEFGSQCDRILEVRRAHRSAMYTVLISAGVVYVLFLASAVTWDLAQAPRGSESDPYSLVALAPFAVFALGFPKFLLFNWRGRSFRRSIPLAMVVLQLYLLWWTHAHSESSPFSAEFIKGLNSGCYVSASATFLWIFVIPLCSRLRKWEVARRDPETALFESLRSLVIQANSPVAPDGVTRHRSRICRTIERSAVLTENMLGSMIDSQDPDRGAYDEVFRRVCYDMRKLKSRVIFPGDSGRDDLVESASRLCMIVAIGRFDLFPESDVPTSFRADWKGKHKKFIRWTGVALAPLILVLLAVVTHPLWKGVHLPVKGIGNYVMMSIFWLVVSALKRISPTAGADLNEAQQLASRSSS